MDNISLCKVNQTVCQNESLFIVHHYYYKEAVLPKLWQLFIMWFNTIGMVVCNCPVFIIAPRLRSLHYTLRYTMLNLATTDLFIGLQSCFRMVKGLVSGYYDLEGFLCSWDAFTNSFLAAVSILSLAFISIDKCLTLKYPLRYKLYMTKNKTLITIGTIWILSLLMCSPILDDSSPTIYYNYSFVCMPDFKQQKVYTTILAFLIDIMPSAIIMTSFTSIWLVLRKRSQNNHKGLSFKPEHHLKIIRTLFFMTAGFYIMWTPFFVVVPIWQMFTDVTKDSFAEFGVMMLGGANSILNPLLYIATLRSYKRAFCRCLRWKVGTRVIVSDTIMTESSIDHCKLRYSKKSNTTTKHSLTL